MEYHKGVPQAAALRELSHYTSVLGNPITYFAKHPIRGTVGGYSRTPHALIRAITHLTELGYDCFCNINPTTPVATKAKRQHITHFSIILLDFDCLDSSEPGAEGLVWERVRGDIDALLESAGVDPGRTTAISTGRGIHCYIHLTPLALTDQEQRLRCERATAHFLRGIAAALPDSMGARLDCTTSDLARVARCPGSINTRCGRMARIERAAQTVMPPSFTQRLLEQAPPSPVLPPLRVGAPQSSNLFMVLPHLTDTAQRFLCEGAPEGRRHHDAFATARSLREAGISQEQALEWVQLGGSHCPKPLTPQECCGPVRSAYR